jgi:hypothetical protein
MLKAWVNGGWGGWRDGAEKGAAFNPLRNTVAPSALSGTSPA